jgi:hypothetical protein
VSAWAATCRNRHENRRPVAFAIGRLQASRRLYMGNLWQTAARLTEPEF